MITPSLEKTVINFSEIANNNTSENTGGFKFFHSLAH